MKELLQALNRTPGVLGSAYVDPETAICDMGESLGGSDALPLVRRTAEACRDWMAARPDASLETAIFVGDVGRIVARPVGPGILVAFAENDASAGLLRMRMRETADQMLQASPPAPPVTATL